MLNLIGQQFGRLTVIAKTALRIGDSIIWHCHCRCGNKTAYISSRDLLHSQSPRRGCGVCHDHKHPLYGIWRGIITRCCDISSNGYKNYGGRGISVCNSWKNDFLSFVEDVGPRPSQDHSIDRIDVNGHYEKDNVRWATFVVQAQNRRPATHGLTDEEIISIYTDKDSVENIAKKFSKSKKTIQNIRAKSYSLKATKLCFLHDLEQYKLQTQQEKSP